jgi:5-formyltetrahydrofolate cyclo-ligase
MTSKAELRRERTAARAARSAADRGEAGFAIVAAALPELAGAPVVAAYVGVGTEPPTQPLLGALVHRGVSVLLPVVVGDSLDWARYDGPAGLVTSARGLLEPTGARLGPAALADAGVVLVPALAVDERGHRLGRGAGHYDRALAGSNARLVAVVFDDDVVPSVPAEPHDVGMHGVLTPSGLRWLEPTQTQ